MNPTRLPSAYGGPGWRPRDHSLREEIGDIWADCGVDSEWGKLHAVILHRPGPELGTVEEAQAFNFLSVPNLERAANQHRSLSEAYQADGVAVHFIAPDGPAPPNLMFAADLFFMTPEGVLLGRPASAVRAGEERHLARRLADLGIPILASVRGEGTFEGADAAWIRPDTVLLATGLRTNRQGADQVSGLLDDLGVQVITTHLPSGTMHLMGAFRLVDEDLGIYWPGRIRVKTLSELKEMGIRTLPIPDEGEARRGHALNFIPLAPRRVLMAAGNPRTQAFLQDLGVECRSVQVDELLKAAGGIGCLTGVLKRKPLN